MESIIDSSSHSSSQSIEIWNRHKGEIEKERVYGDAVIRFIYQTLPGQILGERIFKKPWVSRIYGRIQDSVLSRVKIEKFIREFEIPMEEYEEREFQSFNDFFTRKFKDGKRPFIAANSEMPAFAEGRYFAFEQVTSQMTFPVKGEELSVAKLLGFRDKAQPFIGGPLLLARLCPVDYHRFHFPDQGEVLEQYRLPGGLHSVNPFALRYRGDIFVTNERQVAILETQNFGKLAYVEVGALCVGKIVQTYQGTRFNRGDEKGLFHFGASTVIVCGEKGAWKPNEEILEQTRQGRETLIRLGESVATASN